MATRAEARNTIPSEVLKLTIPVQILKPVQTERILSHTSLSYPFIIRNMSPNKVAEMRLDGNRWVWIAPHGGYTPREHLMAMRWEADYTADPTDIPAPEGAKLMKPSAVLVREMRKKPRNEVVFWSFHGSRYSVEQEGYQSVPTMWHPSIFGISKPTERKNPYMSLIDIKELTHKERKSIRGGIYNQHFGRFLTDHTLNGHFTGDKALLNQLFAMDQVQVDHRGIRVPAKAGLEDVLQTEGFFAGFLQPLVASLNRYAEDLSKTFTDFQPEYVRQKIEEAVLSRREPEDEVMQAILSEITRTSNLLERPVRDRNIQFLREKGYTDEFVGYLARVSDRLPDSGRVDQWKRGFAYTFALYQDRDSAQAIMALSTAVENRPGGVVEDVLGAKLVRPKKPFSKKEIARKKVAYRELVAALDGYVVNS